MDIFQQNDWNYCKRKGERSLQAEILFMATFIISPSSLIIDNLLGGLKLNTTLFISSAAVINQPLVTYWIISV